MDWWRAAVLIAGMSSIVESPASAQPVVFGANLTRGTQTSASGLIVLPFVGETGPTGWATLTVDATLRTISYRIAVVNPTDGSIAHLHFLTANGPDPLLLNFAPPVPTTIVLNNILDDICYDVSAISFEGTVATDDLLLRPEQGIRSADQAVAVILAGKTYVKVVSSSNPNDEIRGALVRRP